MAEIPDPWRVAEEALQSIADPAPQPGDPQITVVIDDDEDGMGVAPHTLRHPNGRPESYVPWPVRLRRRIVRLIVPENEERRRARGRRITYTVVGVVILTVLPLVFAYLGALVGVFIDGFNAVT